MLTHQIFNDQEQASYQITEKSSNIGYKNIDNPYYNFK